MSSPLGGATSNLSPSLFSSTWLSRFHLLSLHSFVEVPTTHQGHCQDTCQLRCFANLKPAILSLEDHLRPFSSRTQQALRPPAPQPWACSPGLPLPYLSLTGSAFVDLPVDTPRPPDP